MGAALPRPPPSGWTRWPAAHPELARQVDARTLVRRLPHRGGTFLPLRAEPPAAILRLLARTTRRLTRPGGRQRMDEQHDVPDAALLQQLASWPAEGEEDEPAP